MKKIQSWHIFISGYTQNRQQSTGLQAAWLSAICNYNKNNKNKNNNCCFFPVLPWDHDWYTLARFIQICSSSKSPPLINIYAYSLGSGCGAVQLASNLEKVANYEIQNMVLADPVYYSPSIFLRWRTFFADRFYFTRRFAPVITIPSNTLNVFWSRQYNNWPRSHSLYSSPSSKTKIHPPVLETSLIHSEMDESDWFQNKVSLLASGSSVA